MFESGSTQALLARLKQCFGLENESCTIELDFTTGEIDINCDSIASLNRVKKPVKKLAKPAFELSAPYVNLRVAGETIYRFPPAVVLNHVGGLPIMPTTKFGLESKSGVLVIPDKPALDQLILTNPNLKIIRWSTGVGIATGINCKNSSGLSPEQWVGRKMDEELANGKRTWIPEEWQKFRNNLFDHLYISRFQYRAHLYTGELVQMTVNAGLATYGGGMVRIVETLDCRTI